MDTEGKIDLSRRDFLKGGALLGAATMTASVLGACSPQDSVDSSVDPDTTEIGQSTVGNATNTFSSYDYSTIRSKSEAGEAGQYDFKYINQPLQIGKFELKSRIIKTASSGREWGQTIDEQNVYHRQLAQGGVGMIVYPVMDWATKEEDVEYLKPLTAAMHEEGVPFFVQIVGNGGERSSSYDLRAPLGGPIIRDEATKTSFKMESGPNVMLTTEQVQEKVETCAQHARLLQYAGFDGIEFNVAAEHFFDSFLSRFWNRERTDQYGPQSIENRCRILTEIIARTKELCGDDFPVGVLFNGCEVNVLYPGDDSLTSTIDEAREMAKIFEAAGTSHLQIRSAMFGNHTCGFMPDFLFTNGLPDTTYGHFYDIKRWWPEFVAEYGATGAFLDTAAKIKEVVSIPVFPVSMQDLRLIPDLIDNAIGEGKIDAVGMTRRLYADFDYPNKVISGELNDIRPCTNCTHCLHGYCRVNPVWGRIGGEDYPEYAPSPATTPKKVLIAGGGPAGLEAAHIAAERGHDVTLYEKEGTWGGLTKTAINIKGPHEKIQDYIDWLVRQCENSGVTMSTGKEVTKEVVEELSPDVVIIATGGTRTIPSIPGIDNPKVASGYVADGEKIVVIGGIECEGAQVAIYLAKQGKQVTLIDELPESVFGWSMPDNISTIQKPYCQAHGVDILAGVKYGSITDTGVTVTLSHDGIEKTIECDSIVLAFPVSPDSSLLDEIKGSVSEVHAIGDCNEHGLIREAVYAGNLLARKL